MDSEELINIGIRYYTSKGGDQEICGDASGATTKKVQLRNQGGDLIVEYRREVLVIWAAIEKFSIGNYSGNPSEDACHIIKNKVVIRNSEGKLLGEYNIDNGGIWANTEEETNNKDEPTINPTTTVTEDKTTKASEEEFKVKENQSHRSRRNKITAWTSILGSFILILAAAVLSDKQGNKSTQIKSEGYMNSLKENSESLEILATSDPQDPSTVLMVGTHETPILIVLSFAKTMTTARANAEMKCMDKLNIPSSECEYTEMERGYIAIVQGADGAGITAGSSNKDEAWADSLKMCKKMSKESGGSGKDCNTIFEYKF